MGPDMNQNQNQNHSFVKAKAVVLTVQDEEFDSEEDVSAP